MAGGPPSISADQALDRARALAERGGRQILGITGVPGAGKSTLAQRVVDALGSQAAYVPMDGFHLANQVLVRLGRRDRKGALDTFDGDGFLSLLRRLQRPAEPVVYAPTFVRQIEEPIAGAIEVPESVALVVTEGNYLLVDRGAWTAVRGLLAEAWYVEADEAERIARLVARHQAFGKSPAEARRWALGSDQVNADLVAATRSRADVIVHLGSHAPD